MRRILKPDGKCSSAYMGFTRALGSNAGAAVHGGCDEV